MENLLVIAKETEGYNTVMDMLEEAAYDGVAVGICDKCHATRQVEPDASNYDCWECDGGKVNSVLVLGGLI